MSEAENKIINPDSTMIQQSEGMYQKYLMVLLWKLAKTERVKVTAEEMQAMFQHFAPGAAVLGIQGHSDSIEFFLTTHEEAERLAQWGAQRVQDANKHGH